MRHGIDTGFLVAAAVAEHPDHVSARLKLAGLLAAGDRFALAPQVLAEFIHIVTDPRRFAQPLDMASARDLAEQGWTARDVDPVFPTEAAVRQFLDWLRQHQLGRKRLLDFHACGFSPRFSRASGSRGTNHRLQAPRPSGGGSIRRKAFQAGVYPPPAQPTGFSR